MITSAYQKVLGAEFTKLGPIIQLSHGSISPVSVTGIIDVEYGKNIFVGLLNKLSKMPPKGMGQKVLLRVERLADKEIWKRHFGDRIFLTEQFEKNGLLCESAGTMTLCFKTTVKDGGLNMVQTKTLFAGITLPKWFGVQSIATSVEEGNGWRLLVEVRSPILGLMLKYSGLVHIVDKDIL